eukprot:scaffold124836_cov52-Phaeocystis_antarctica.AAC.1
MPQAAPSFGQPRPILGQSAAWAALAGHIGLVFHIGPAASSTGGHGAACALCCTAGRPRRQCLRGTSPCFMVDD